MPHRRSRIAAKLAATAVLILGCQSISTAWGAKILFLYPIATRSETHVFFPLVEALLARGHELTVVTPNKHTLLSNSTNQTFKQIVPTTPLMFSEFNSAGSVLDFRAQMLSTHKARFLFQYDPRWMTNRCHDIFRHPEFQQLYRNAEEGTYDLIVMTSFFQTCFDGVVHRVKAPFILIASMPVWPWVTSIATGFHSPPSFVPISLLEYDDSMGFWDRLSNTVAVWYFTALSWLVFNPALDDIGRQYMGADIPPSTELERNASMVFSHAHFTLTFARPMMPDTIEIGGIHCRPAKPLPQDLEAFVAGAEDGVILFSLGSMVLAHELPEATIAMFLRVFSRLPHRVVWKFETEVGHGVPDNVKLSKWLPQQDILGHPNTKLFISHGGLLSTFESAYHAVPVLGMPIFVDQMVNLNNIRKLGYSLQLEISQLDEVVLETTIRKMLTDPQFADRAKELSARFRDQPETPIERTVFWTEYVIRHKGAHHLRSGARNLNFWQYHSVDVVVALMAVCGASVVCILVCVRWYCAASKCILGAMNSLGGNGKKSQ